MKTEGKQVLSVGVEIVCGQDFSNGVWKSSEGCPQLGSGLEETDRREGGGDGIVVCFRGVSVAIPSSELDSSDSVDESGVREFDKPSDSDKECSSDLPSTCPTLGPRRWTTFWSSFILEWGLRRAGAGAFASARTKQKECIRTDSADDFERRIED